MDTPEFSVVIPTHNRKDILLECLTALRNQTIPRDDFEVVVVDDGSADGSAAAARDFLAKHFSGGQVLEGRNRGPAHARNRGILAGSAPLILLIGDDMIGGPDLLAEHLSWHQKHPEEGIAILGHVDWHPRLPDTPLLRWFKEKDKPFNFGRLRPGQEVDYRYFLSSNISFKRDFVVNHPLFDSDFPFAAMEDIEFGYRLQKRGLRILYNRRAVTYHDHPMTLEDYCRRQERIGESAVILFEKIPEMKPEKGGNGIPRRKFRHTLVLAACRSLNRIFPPGKNPLLWRYYKTRAHFAYIDGLEKGQSRPH